MLYHECTYGDDNQARAVKYFHSTATEAARVARDAGVKKLIIGHFSARYEDEKILLEEARCEFSNTFLAEEMAVFNV